jgi:hypothetical protein
MEDEKNRKVGPKLNKLYIYIYIACVAELRNNSFVTDVGNTLVRDVGVELIGVWNIYVAVAH